MNSKPDSHDQYISQFDAPVREKLEGIRKCISDSAPGAAEVISYSMPAFKLKKVLVYYAVVKSGIAFYPTPHGIEAFQTETAPYLSTKSSMHFPLDEALPTELIAKITRLRYDACK